MKLKTIILTLCGVGVVIAAGVYVDHRMSMDPSLNALTQATGTPTTPDLQNYGPAPEFAGISNWINTSTSSVQASAPLTLAQLKGKVVLIDFWTYSCINCIRTLPYVTKWYDTYKDQGLVVVGVHTPEFAFEKDSGNVADAVKRFGIHYPVAQDNDYGTWNAYSNQYWPAEYLIDKNGNIVHTHFGEGEYNVTENAIRELLGMAATLAPDNGADLSGVQSPEMYFGTARLQNLVSSQTPSSAGTYTLPTNVPPNHFALGGAWSFTSQSTQLLNGSGKIRLKFHSGNVYMVASSTRPATLLITVDGKVQPSVIVEKSQLYTLFSSKDYSDHVIEIQVNQSGFEAYTFTFG